MRNSDREFAKAFLALHLDPNSNAFKGGIEVLRRALARAREEGRQEERVRVPRRSSGEKEQANGRTDRTL